MFFLFFGVLKQLVAKAWAEVFSPRLLPRWSVGWPALAAREGGPSLLLSEATGSLKPNPPKEGPCNSHLLLFWGFGYVAKQPLLRNSIHIKKQEDNTGIRGEGQFHTPARFQILVKPFASLNLHLENGKSWSPDRCGRQMWSALKETAPVLGPL